MRYTESGPNLPLQKVFSGHIGLPDLQKISEVAIFWKPQVFSMLFLKFE